MRSFYTAVLPYNQPCHGRTHHHTEKNGRRGYSPLAQCAPFIRPYSPTTNRVTAVPSTPPPKKNGRKGDGRLAQCIHFILKKVIN
ncbi:MAG: hypothetical protein HND44_12740 [Chloroflexi bacterium]|nr:hypothetical protein [Chloroflexota bacterium]